MGQVSAKQKKLSGQQNGPRKKQQEVVATCGDNVIEDPLQDVYDIIVNNYKRNIDRNLTNMLLFYTTAKEKYLVKLISEGNDIPKKVTDHVVNYYCEHKAHMIDDSYGCSSGYILKKEDFLAHDIKQCNTFHKLNQDLRCYHGKLYYSIDIFVNPFGEWKPKNLLQENESVRGIYGNIVKRWPMYQMFGAIPDMALFSSLQERYLIKLINEGKCIPSEIISHVVDGCDSKAHLLSNDFGCCYGFVLTKPEFVSHVYERKKQKRVERQLGIVYGPDGKPVRNPAKENFPNCEIKHKINDRMECSYGILRYSRKQCQDVCVLLQSRRNEECSLPYSSEKNVQVVYRRIKWKRANDWDIAKYYTWFKNMRSWERYLIDLIEKGEDISIEIISHVLDGHNGCYIGAHMLDENYGCCCGFILKKDEFMLHDFHTCKSHHKLTKELVCENCMVYHISKPWESPSSAMPHLGGNPVSAQRLKGIIPEDNQPIARPPPAPAPPPPDHLDQ